MSGKALCTRVQGFSLHTARTVVADDRLGLGRLSLDPDGRVRYRLHRTRPMPWATRALLDHYPIPCLEPEADLIASAEH